MYHILRLFFVDCKFKRIENGIWLTSKKELTANQLKKLSLIPGIANFAIAEESKLNIKDIQTTIDLLLKNSNDSVQKSFRITASRSNKNRDRKEIG